MIYPGNFEQKVGFDLIRDMVREKCISPMGRQYVEKIRFGAARDVIRKLLTQIAEFKDIIQNNSAFPSKDYFDLRDELLRLVTPGTYIEPEALFDLRTSLITISEILQFFDHSGEEDYPELKRLTESLYLPDHIIPSADKIIDDKGEIRDTASGQLSAVRKQLRDKAKQVIAETKKAFNQAKKSGWVIDNAEITIRNGRPVIPLKVSDKRALGGIIHDESASGQTVFVEPSKSFEINNQIRELENEERREIVRILSGFSDIIRPDLENLVALYRFLGLIDFIRAKTLLALAIKAQQPELSDENKLSLRNAIHPLLFVAHQATGKPVVPLDLELNHEQRVLIISGPNAGGKSVCLKTVGCCNTCFNAVCRYPVHPTVSFQYSKGYLLILAMNSLLKMTSAPTVPI